MEKEKLFVAFGTDDGINMKSDDHCGQSKYFYLYEISDNGYTFIEERENIKYSEDKTRKHGDPGKAKAVSSVLDGVDVIVCNNFGPNIIRILKKFVAVVVREKSLEKSVKIIKNNIDRIKSELDNPNRKVIILKPYNRNKWYLKPIGFIYTPYKLRSPYQPIADEKGIFKVVINNEYKEVLKGLERLEYIYLIFHLHLIDKDIKNIVEPPWVKEKSWIICESNAKWSQSNRVEHCEIIVIPHDYWM